MLIFIVIILIGMFIKQRRREYDLIIILYICILQYFQKGAPDFEAYEQLYDYIGSGSNYLDTGYGWMVLCKFGNLFHLGYKQFQVILLCICLLIVRFIVHKIAGSTKNTPVFFSLYLLYPALIDMVQFRFFISAVIVFIGVSCLTENNLSNYIKFCICIGIASTIHSAAVFYFLFALIPIYSKIKKALFGLILLSSIVLFGFKARLGSLISIFINDLRVTRYLESTDPIGLYGLAAYMATLVLFCLLLNQADIISKKRIVDRKVRTLISNIYIMSILSWIVLPLTSFDTNFFRVQRIMWPLLYFVIILLLNQNIRFISIKNFNINIKMLSVMISASGFIFYILWFSYIVVQAYLF